MEKMREITETLAEAVAKWRRGECVSSIELGGIGPSYEQACQVALWEICARWLDREEMAPAPDGDKVPASFHTWVGTVIRDLKGWGFSGAQVGAATYTSYRFLLNGYAKEMAQCPDDRRIIVDNSLEPRRREPDRDPPPGN